MSVSAKLARLALVAVMMAPLAPVVAHAQLSDGTPQQRSNAITAAEESISIVVDEGKVIETERPAASIFVANPNIADIQVKSGNLLYIFGRQAGDTTFYAVDANDKIISSYRVQVGINLTALSTAIRKITGDNRVKVDSMQDMILLSGTVSDATTAQDVMSVAARFLPQTVAGNVGDIASATRNHIVNRMSVEGSNQVNIRVRVAEVSREASKTLGLSSNLAGSYFGDVDFSLGFDSNVAFTGAAASGALGSTWGGTTLNAVLDALVEDGLATVLAQPNLTALSGETANFLAGGEFPIPVSSQDGVVTVEFREFGVRLAFTPTVMSGGRINLRVRPEVSERDDSRSVVVDAFVVPALRTRRAETSIELGSGQSFAIAGLLQANTTQTIEKMPGLGDIPVLGALFRSDRFLRNETELVIVVTPYLVRPVGAGKLQVPTDGFVPPNDVDRWVNGRMNSEAPTPKPVANAGAAKNVAEAGLVGDVGYVLK